MVAAVWSVKGGVGTTSVAALLALSHVEQAEDVLLVDLCGDMPAALGVVATDGPGVSEWCAIEGAEPDALARIELEVGSGLSLLPRGQGEFLAGWRRLVNVLESSERRVIVDCGDVRAVKFRADFVTASSTRVMVARQCFLNLSAASRTSIEPTAVVLVKEPNRALRLADVEAVTEAPVVAQISMDRTISRSIDSGLTHARLPRRLLRTMGQVLHDAA